MLSCFTAVFESLLHLLLASENRTVSKTLVVHLWYIDKQLLQWSESVLLVLYVKKHFCFLLNETIGRDWLTDDTCDWNSTELILFFVLKILPYFANPFLCVCPNDSNASAVFIPNTECQALK